MAKCRSCGAKNNTGRMVCDECAKGMIDDLSRYGDAPHPFFILLGILVVVGVIVYIFHLLGILQ